MPKEKATRSRPTAPVDFCQWCYDRGLRYPDNGRPWAHATGCPHGPSSTTSLAASGAPLNAGAHKAPPPPNWPDLYVAELELTGRVTDAAAAALISIRGVQTRRHADPEFAQREQEALACCRDRALSELTRRAIDGTEEITITATGIVNRRQIYSDTLLLRLLEFQETGQVRQRQQVETGAPGAFKTRAELQAMIAKRDEEFAKAKAEMAAEDARAAAPAVPVNPAM